METSPATVGAGVCRVTVVAPRMRLDVAVPADVPVAALVPTLLWHTGEQVIEAGAAHGGWALQRLGEAPFDTSRTCQSLNILDGDILYFRPRGAATPELMFDDPVDGIGTILRDQTKRWSPAATRRCALVALTILPLLGLFPLLTVGPNWPVPAGIAGAAAVILMLTAAALSRAAGDDLAGVFCGIAALPYAAACGLLAPLGSHPLSSVGAPEVATAGALTFTVAVLGASMIGVGMIPGEQKPPQGSVLLSGAVMAAVVGSAGLAALRWNAEGCAALASALALALTVLIPRIAYRASGLPPAAISLNAADLRAQSTPIPTAALTARSLTADRLITALLAGAAPAVTGGIAFALLAPGWTPPVLAAVTVLLLALRARLFSGLAQRWWLLGPAMALALLTAAAVAVRWHGNDVGLGIDLGAALLGTAVVGQFAVRPERRFAPTLARWGDLLELLGVISTVPLALLILGTFGYFRSLGG